MIAHEEFLKLPTNEIASLMQSAGSQTCVFPINGTRRWFILEHGDKNWENSSEAYISIAANRSIELLKLMFDHGIDTLLIPVIGLEMLENRKNYMQIVGADGLKHLATHDFLTFYSEYGIRVHYYGDYRKKLAHTPYAHLIDLFTDVTQKTEQNNRFRLFYGVFADDPIDKIAKLIVDYQATHKKTPNKKEIIESYYGEYIDKVNLFIGFDKLAVFDYPLLGTGDENLYFTVAPSLYMKQEQLRNILYDYMFTRKHPDPNYAALSPEDWQSMREFYYKKQGCVLGTGKIFHHIWIPNLNTDTNEN